MNPESSPYRTAFEYVWRSPWVRAAVWTVLAAGLIWLLAAAYGNYSFVLTIALIGYLLAYLLNPLVEVFRRMRMPRPLAVVLVFVILAGLMVLGSLLITQVVVQLGEFAQQVPAAIERLGEALGGVTNVFSDWLSGFRATLINQIGLESEEQLTGAIMEQLSDLLGRASTSIAGFLQGVLTGGTGALVEGAASIISGVAQAVLILIAAGYFLWDYPRFSANFHRLVPVRYREIHDDLARKSDMAIGGYLRGQILITIIIGFVIWLGLMILGVPLALAVAFLAAIFNLVPYLGPIVGAVPAVLLGLTVSPLTAVLVVGVFILSNMLEGYVLQPLILSRSVNIHPVTVLLAIIGGLGLFGLIGALLAVPVVGFLKLLLEDYILTRPAYRTGPAASAAQVEAPGAGRRRG